ncbi:MAG: stage V sporulation protein AC [Firmicutes bacterium]|nr:stage V sporulation protein AC [Bacillota bacterium]
MKANQRQAAVFKKLVQTRTPPRPILRNTLQAFLVGGMFSLVGEGVMKLYTVVLQLGPKDAGPLTSASMIFLGAFLTALGVYDKIGQWGGMGAALPITGFANSIVSPAMEFKREGLVLGVSAKMFTIAGPVIVYASLTAVAVAVVKLLLKGG